MTGSEVMFLLIIGLVVLGPEKLPDAIRRMGKLYAELKRMSSGVQTDFRKVMDEPIKEMMNTTNSMKALFTDTASEFQSAAKDFVEPTFFLTRVASKARRHKIQNHRILIKITKKILPKETPFLRESLKRAKVTGIS